VQADLLGVTDPGKARAAARKAKAEEEAAAEAEATGLSLEEPAAASLEEAFASQFRASGEKDRPIDTVLPHTALPANSDSGILADGSFGLRSAAAAQTRRHMLRRARMQGVFGPAATGSAGEGGEGTPWEEHEAGVPSWAEPTSEIRGQPAGLGSLPDPGDEMALSFWGAARRGEADAVLRYLIGGQDPSEPSPERGDPALVLAARAGMHEMAVILLAAGADPDGRDAAGRTAMHHASQRGDCEMVGLLVARGLARTGVRDSYGETPVHSAAASGHVRLVRLLLQHGRRCLLAYTRSPRFVGRCEQLFNAGIDARLTKWDRQVYRLGWFPAAFRVLLDGLFQDYDRQLAANARWVELREGLSAEYGSHVPPPVWPPRKPGRHVRARARMLRRGLFAAKGFGYGATGVGGEGAPEGRGLGEKAGRWSSDPSAEDRALDPEEAMQRKERERLHRLARGRGPADSPSDSDESDARAGDVAGSRMGPDDSGDEFSYGSRTPRSEAGDADAQRQRQRRADAARRSRRLKRRQAFKTGKSSSKAAGDENDSDDDSSSSSSSSVSSIGSSTEDSDGRVKLPDPADPTALVKLVYGDAGLMATHPAAVLPRIASERLLAPSIAVGIVRVAGAGATDTDAVSPAVFVQLCAASLFAFLVHAPSRRGATPLHSCSDPHSAVTSPGHVATAQALVNEFGAEMMVGDVGAITPLDLVLKRIHRRAASEWALLAAVSNNPATAQPASAQSASFSTRRGPSNQQAREAAAASKSAGVSKLMQRAASQEWGIDAPTQDLLSRSASAAGKAMDKLRETLEARGRLLEEAKAEREREKEMAHFAAQRRKLQQEQEAIHAAATLASREAVRRGLVVSVALGPAAVGLAPALATPGVLAFTRRLDSALVQPSFMEQRFAAIAEGAGGSRSEGLPLVAARPTAPPFLRHVRPGSAPSGLLLALVEPLSLGVDAEDTEVTIPVFMTDAEAADAAAAAEAAEASSRSSTKPDGAESPTPGKRQKSKRRLGKAASSSRRALSSKGSFAELAASIAAASKPALTKQDSSASVGRKSVRIKAGAGKAPGRLVKEFIKQRRTGQCRRAQSVGAVELHGRLAGQAAVPTSVRMPDLQDLPSVADAVALTAGGAGANAIAMRLTRARVADALVAGLVSAVQRSKTRLASGAAPGAGAGGGVGSAFSRVLNPPPPRPAPKTAGPAPKAAGAASGIATSRPKPAGLLPAPIITTSPPAESLDLELQLKTALTPMGPPGRISGMRSLDLTSAGSSGSPPSAGTPVPELLLPSMVRGDGGRDFTVARAEGSAAGPAKTARSELSAGGHASDDSDSEAGSLGSDSKPGGDPFDDALSTGRMGSQARSIGAASMLYAQLLALPEPPTAAQVTAEAMAEITSTAQLEPVDYLGREHYPPVEGASIGATAGETRARIGGVSVAGSSVATAARALGVPEVSQKEGRGGGVAVEADPSLSPDAPPLRDAAQLLQELLMDPAADAGSDSRGQQQHGETQAGDDGLERGKDRSTGMGGDDVASMPSLVSVPESNAASLVIDGGSSAGSVPDGGLSDSSEHEELPASVGDGASGRGAHGSGVAAPEPSSVASLSARGGGGGGGGGGGLGIRSAFHGGQPAGVAAEGTGEGSATSAGMPDPRTAGPLVAVSPRSGPVLSSPRLSAQQRNQHAARAMIAKMESQGAKFHYDVPLLALLKTAAARQAAGIRVSDWADGMWMGEKRRLEWDRLKSPLRMVELEGVPMTVAEWQKFGVRLLEAKRFLVQQAAARLQRVREEESRQAELGMDNPERLVAANVPGSGAMIKAKHRRAHRAEFLRSLGIRKFMVAGKHVLKVPPTVREVMLQLWGGGGGGGRRFRSVLGERGRPESNCFASMTWWLIILENTRY
jgi:hypothetical protein